jgi:hypothetical protein
MNELSVGFSQDSDATILAKAMKIHTALTIQPGLGFFPAPVPTMVIFKTASDALQNALAGDNTSSNAALRKQKRDALVLLMQKLAAGLELTADGNLVALAASGYELKAKSSRSSGPLPIP